MQLLLEPNPRRRRRSRKARRRRSTPRHGRRSRRPNPFLAGNPTRKRRRRRRRGGSRSRGSRRRPNPFRIPGVGGGLGEGVKQGAGLVGAFFVNDFAYELAYRFLPEKLKAGNIGRAATNVVLGLALSLLVKKFGGPIKNLAGMIAAVGVFRAAQATLGGKISGTRAASKIGGGLGAFMTEPEESIEGLALGDAGENWNENQLLGLSGYLSAGENALEPALESAYG